VSEDTNEALNATAGEQFPDPTPSDLPTQEAIDQARAAAVARRANKAADIERIVDSAVSDLLEYLQSNRDHIGAFGIVVLPKDGDVLVDPKTGKAVDGLTMRETISAPLLINLSFRVDDLKYRSNPLADLLR